ncbi:hypothetical protein TNCV_1560371 [Trichonephila clavipes]|nr:hypothetical protein TNCV_1560371 [Trichonephila clavipes]
MDRFNLGHLHIILKWAQVLRAIASNLGIKRSPKKWENDYWSRAMLLSSNHSPIFLGLNTVSRGPLEGRVFCRGGTCCSHPSVGGGNASEMHGRIASFPASASCRGKANTSLALGRRNRAISAQNTRPKLLAPIETRWSSFEHYSVSKPCTPKNTVWGWHTESVGLGQRRLSLWQPLAP